jgi:RNA polymerase sigma-70 factor, ECF subfamily
MVSTGQRQAIVLHHLVGLSVDEIAKETGAAAGTVKARLSRGRHALAPLLDDADSGSGPRAVRV